MKTAASAFRAIASVIGGFLLDFVWLTLEAEALSVLTDSWEFR
jgi:hypothetical protein